MPRMDSEDRMDPFNIETLSLFIKERTDDVNAYLTELNKNNRYIEAQLWNDDYLNKKGGLDSK